MHTCKLQRLINTFFFYIRQRDLPSIKGHYQQLYGQPLKKDVEKETSGDYRNTLIKVIDKVGEEKPSPVKKEPKKTEKDRPKSPEKIIVKEAQQPLQKKNEDEDKINENDEDAVKLYKAMKGFGAKKDVITEVITRNSNSQRQTLKKRYNELYKKVR